MGLDCVIDFENNPEKVVYANELLKGHVKLNLTESKLVRGIFIKFTGDSRTEWSKEVRDEFVRKRIVRRYFRGHENLLRKEIRLFGEDNSEMQIERGEHVFDFEFTLPANLPSSFEGEFGHIRYVATVILDIPRWPDDKLEQPFTVIKPLNLNDDFELKYPVRVKKDHRYYPCYFLCCFPSDPLSIESKIPVGGYAPGQSINLYLGVNNKSDTIIPEFTMELVQLVKYHAESETQEKTITILEKESSRGVGADMERIIRINLEVPSFPPTDELTSNIIKIKYFLRITASGTYCDNPEIELPIVIGTQPIDDFVETALLDESSPSDPLTPIESDIQPSAPQVDENPNGDAAPAYSTVAPPTYEEAMQASGSKGNNFKPKYKMFRRQTSYSLKD